MMIKSIATKAPQPIATNSHTYSLVWGSGSFLLPEEPSVAVEESSLLVLAVGVWWSFVNAPNVKFVVDIDGDGWAGFKKKKIIYKELL